MDGGICRYGCGDALRAELNSCTVYGEKELENITKILILVLFYAKRLKSKILFGIIKWADFRLIY